MVNQLILKPAVWCIKLYDEFWAPKLRRAPDILHEIAISTKGITPASKPAPLPRRRKRALTNPLPKIDNGHGLSYGIRRSRQRSDEQRASMLLHMLPLEIRNMIYAELLTDGGQKLIHMLPKDGKLGHWRCRLQSEDVPCAAQNRRCMEGWLSYRNSQWNMDHSGRLLTKTDDGLLSLLMVCRTIYTEGIYMLYSGNTFHFHDPGDVRYFSCTILPQRLNQIQSLLIDWERPYSIFNKYNTIPKRDEKEYLLWCNAWEVIANMRNMQEMTVVLKKHKFHVLQARREKMCEPMMAIQGLKIFELRVPWDEPTDWSFAAKAPFKVIKAPPPRKDND